MGAEEGGVGSEHGRGERGQQSEERGGELVESLAGCALQGWEAGSAGWGEKRRRVEGEESEGASGRGESVGTPSGGKGTRRRRGGARERGSADVEKSRRTGPKKTNAKSCVRNEFEKKKCKVNKASMQTQLLVRKRRLARKVELLVSGELDPGIASAHLAD